MAIIYRYPRETIDNKQDLIRFEVVEYVRKEKTITVPQTFPGVGLIPSFVYERDIKTNPLIGGPDVNQKAIETIFLPIPGQLSDTNAVNYGENSLNSFYAAVTSSALNITGAPTINSFFQKIASTTQQGLNQIKDDKNLQEFIKTWSVTSAISALGANISVDQLFARATGAIINPNMELLFSGPTLRQFKFQFKMTPRYQGEAQEVKDIIRCFKKNMAPEGRDVSFLKTPNIFRIGYVGASSNYLNKFKLCALTNMSVNYTGEGNYATYSDGAPVSMIMDLAFQELSPVYREDYKKPGADGYDEDLHGGVGY